MDDDPDGCLSVWRKIEAGGGCLVPLTSITPSTTCAALTTLNTGVSPVSHGNFAYELWLREYDVVYNMIYQSPMLHRVDTSESLVNRFSPQSFLPVDTIDDYMLQHGVMTTALHPAPIAHSSLTKMLFPSASRFGYHSMGDLFYQMENISSTSFPTPSYFYVYWGEIDELSHVYGPDDPRVRMALRDFSRYLDRLIETLTENSPGKTLLIVTADHGFQATPIHKEYDLAGHPDFLENLKFAPTGENRLTLLHIKEGRTGKIRNYVNRMWPNKFEIYNSRDVLESGLLGLGPMYEESLSRAGDLMLIARDDAYLWWSTRENCLLGRHGGLGQDEMLVPLTLLPL